MLLPCAEWIAHFSIYSLLHQGLPDAAAIEAASWVRPDNTNTVLIDASTAHRVNPDWDYGFPELSKEQKEAIKSSRRIANPGCYPTGFIALTRPLVDAGILPEGTPLTVNAISGYSGGGKGLMEIYESGDCEPWGSYGFTLVSCNVVWSMHFPRSSHLIRKRYFLSILFLGTQACSGNGQVFETWKSAHLPTGSVVICTGHGGVGPSSLRMVKARNKWRSDS